MVNLKYPLTFICVIVMVIILFPLKTVAKSFTIDEVDINAYIYPNGDLYVEELYTYTFNGSYNGTTRTIGDDKFKGIVFFEGYQVADDAELSTITPENVKPLPVEHDEYTFKVHQPAKDETKKVFYRYRLSEVARKYEDVGEFYWRFFDSMGEEDLHHLHVSVYLADQDKLPDDTYGFMHDLTGGEFELTPSGLHYQNAMLPGGEPFELRLLFPTELLNEMEYTKKDAKLSSILAEEKAYDEQLDYRNQWLPKLEKLSSQVFITLIFVLFFAIFYPPRMIRLFRTPASEREVEELDSLTLVSLYRKLNFKLLDIHAALFRLYQKGELSLQYLDASTEARKNGYRSKKTFKYILENSSQHLNEVEKYLIDWLFKPDKQGKLSFSIDQIPLVNNHGTHRGTIRETRHERRQFTKRFNEWKRIAKKDADVHHLIKPVFLRSIFTYLLLPFWLFWMNVYLWTVTVDIDVIVKLFVGVLSVVIAIILMNIKKKRLITTIFFFVALMFLPDVGFDIQLTDFYDFTVILMFISGFLPTIYPTFEGISYLRGIKKWRRQLKKNHLALPEDPAHIEKIFQHAIVVNLGFDFHMNYGQKIRQSSSQMYPFLISPYETSHIYKGVHTTSYNSGSSSGRSFSTSGGSGGSGGGGGAGAF